MNCRDTQRSLESDHERPQCRDDAPDRREEGPEHADVELRHTARKAQCAAARLAGRWKILRP